MAAIDALYRSANRTKYLRVVSDAHAVVIDALRNFGEPAVVAVSGGKDSVAMTHVVAQHCRPIIMWNDSGLEMPESGDIVHRLAKQLRLSLEVAKGDGMIIKLSKTRDEIVDDESMDDASGDTARRCMIDPQREMLRKLNAMVEFVGLRMNESRKRRMLIGHNGSWIRSNMWGCGVAWPMRYWGADDVFAYIDEYSLPLHPAYSRVFGQQRNNIRVSWIWDSARTGDGGMEYMRRYYPELWRRLRTIGMENV